MPRQPSLQDSSWGKLGLHDFAIERFHEVFVRTGGDRFLNEIDIVYCGAKDNDWLIAIFADPQFTQDFDAVHDGHIPNEQDYVRHRVGAVIKRDLAVCRLIYGKIEFFQYLSSSAPHDFGIVDNQT